jgi:indolepyruvate ferredoxin oxidoreductase
MLAQLDAQHLADLVALAKAPMQIRGYGPVKEVAVHNVKGEVERLMAQLAVSRK